MSKKKRKQETAQKNQKSDQPKESQESQTDWIPGGIERDGVVLDESQRVTKQDKSIYVPQRDKIKKSLTIRKQEFTETQKRFMDAALHKDTKILWISGPAGSSKTYLSVLAGLTLLNTRRVSDILYVRSVVESAEKSLGFLPGEAGDKMAPYLEPLMEKLEEFLCKGDIKYLLEDKRVEGIPINYLRGRNFNARMIISDESQNMSFKEITTLITRVGEFSKLFICGDTMQSDLPHGKSGFKPMFDLFNDEESRNQGIFCFEFTEDDIMRSDLVKYLIIKLKRHNELNNNSNSQKK